MQSKTVQESEFFSPTLRLGIVVFLFVTAFAVRTYRINEFPANLSPGRPYHSIIIARGSYFENLESIPEWRREVARINKKHRPIAEPRVFETITVFAYRIAGGEYLWIPRLLSSIFWLVGGGVLYIFVKKLFSADAAVFSILFYLFLPYGVSASRSFIPRPLMIMLLMFSLLTIFRHYEQPSIPRLLLAAILSAPAIFVYPLAMFPVFGAFVSLAFYKDGIFKAVISPKFLLFAVIAFLPFVVYYVYNLLSDPFLSGHLENLFSLSYLRGSFFWRGWFNQIQKVVGFPALVGGLIGVFMFRKGHARALSIGLWAGYLLYALIFCYHNATHPYYQVILIPIIALSLGPIGAQITNYLSKTCTNWYWRIPVFAVIVLALILHLYRIRQQMFNPNFEREVKIAQEVGNTVRHSTKTILLTRFYMSPFKYHAEVSGKFWPDRGYFVASAMRGERIPSAEERFNTQFLKDNPEYFIITNFQEFMRQPDLKNFLVQNFPVLAQNQNYLIFDLRKKSKTQKEKQ